MFVSEQHEFVLMCEASIAGPRVDRRSTGCSRLMNSTLLFLEIVTDVKRKEIRHSSDTMITVIILFIEIQTKAFLPSPHVFSKCSPLISKSTTRVKFTLRCSSQMIKEIHPMLPSL